MYVYVYLLLSNDYFSDDDERERLVAQLAAINVRLAQTHGQLLDTQVNVT